MDFLQRMNFIKVPQKKYSMPFKKKSRLWFWSSEYPKNLCSDSTIGWHEPAGQGNDSSGLRWPLLGHSYCIMLKAFPRLLALLCRAVLHHASLSPVIPVGRGEEPWCGHMLEWWKYSGDIQPLSWDKCSSSTLHLLNDFYSRRCLAGGEYVISLLSLVLIRKYYRCLSIVTATELGLLTPLAGTSLSLHLLDFIASK